ncbi:MULTISPECIES: hypothetical protein [Streptomyces]|uniref:hypothetical protein n=1 Tax=Streptomyces TaxID=1883 RepID=UPI002E2BC3F5|nr:MULTISPECIES: hypothetical protein [Streptomyces]
MRNFKRAWSYSLFPKLKHLVGIASAATARSNLTLNPWAELRRQRKAIMALVRASGEIVNSYEREISSLRTATDTLSALFDDSMLACHLAAGLTCAEVDQLADGFLAAGREDIADLWLTCHAEGDTDEGDLHIKEPAEYAVAA